MTSKEFANGLYKLADRHANDKRTIFDDDWSLICTEAAKMILELQRQIDEMKSSNEAWTEWYEQEQENEAKKKSREVKFDDIVPRYEEPERVIDKIKDHYFNRSEEDNE